MNPADWDTSDTHVLLNPRLPETERRALMEIYAAMPALPAHVWLTTSGSSGLKWVALSKQALLTSAEAVNTHLQSDKTDAWALALPDFHVGGLGILARGHLSGARVYRCGEARWDALAFHAFLRETGTTLTALVPAQLHDLVRAGLISPPTLRAVIIGGGALDAALYAQARALSWPALPSYGLSECCSQVATAPPDALPETMPGALPLLAHVVARTNGAGHIELRSASLLTGYGLPAVHAGGAPRFVDPKHGGWFETEDRGRVADNSLTLRGRSTDFVKIGGESVELPRLERILAQACEPGGPDAVLLAVPDARLGTVIHLVAAGEPTDAQRAFVKRLVSAYDTQTLPFERIRQVHWVDSLPRSPLGKLLRTTLLARLGYHSA